MHVLMVVAPVDQTSDPVGDARPDQTVLSHLDLFEETFPVLPGTSVAKPAESKVVTVA
jgi:hypothetical protein